MRTALSKHRKFIRINKLTALLKQAVFFNSKNNYRIANLNHPFNKKLKQFLIKHHFFQFHTSNKKQSIVSLHQIILFFHKGFYLFLKGFTCLKGQTEIHHLDHDCSNNSLNNLVYVSPQINRMASDGIGSYHGIVNNKNVHTDAFGFYNTKTKLAKLLKLTTLRTLTRLGFNPSDIPPLSSYLLSLPQSLSHKLISFWRNPCVSLLQSST